MKIRLARFTNMGKFLLTIIGVCAFFSTIGFAAEPTANLASKEAIRLISLKANVLPSAMEIVFIVDGSAHCSEGFEVKHVRRVAAHPRCPGWNPTIAPPRFLRPLLE